MVYLFCKNRFLFFTIFISLHSWYVLSLSLIHIYTGDLKYYLTAGYDTGLVGVLYQSILSDKNLLTELQAASGLDCDVPYIKELIDSGVSTENDSNININNLVSDLRCV